MPVATAHSKCAVASDRVPRIARREDSKVPFRRTNLHRPVESEKQACHDGAHGEICTFPEFPLHNLGCRYEFAPLYLQQCANRHDLPEFKRNAFRKMSRIMPNFHCTE